MFTERFNILLNELGASVIALSSYAGFDRTNISRIKSGKRIPTPSSSTASKISHAIYSYSKDNRSYTRLCKTIGINSSSNRPYVESKIIEWLYEGSENIIASSGKARTTTLLRKQKKDAFGNRFNISMELADISNKRLSQLVHADPSLISRYRNGVRTPISNPELSTQLSEILFSKILSSDKSKELSDLMKCPEDELDEDSFSSWLYDTDEKTTDDSLTAAENFLDIFDSFRPDNIPNLYSPEDAMKGIPITEDSVYIGIDGLRMAVLRFLYTAVSLHAKELYLYSDESQEWMTHDSSFLLRWASLMANLVKNGTRIMIIHNLDRSLSEMNDAIKSWLPLYMSGMIESYYCRKQKNNRFSHTVFLNPESGCISSFHAAGTDKNNIYHYYTDQRFLDICMDEYKVLLKDSSPLIRPVKSNVLSEVSDITVVQDVLSLSTMSKELVTSFNSPALISQWESFHTALIEKLENNTVRECIPLAKKEKVLAGIVPIWQAQGVEKIFYTAEQYNMHLRDIRALSEKYDNYRFFPLAESPFPNIELIVSETLTKITPGPRPGFSFAFTHVPMCRAFMDYTETLIKQNA
ncbi:hypothetical protein [Butyrivibrio sp. VCB2001]|uniref:hypothetical protein n=1 Tax=Butyrivibrio sp. VCB2001 TaxID=1280667 RepID=UPI00041A9165|nr:hypothetical protein [Butyrivibrio sp. VCB2001]